MALLPNHFFPVEQILRVSDTYESTFSHVLIVRQDQKNIREVELYKDRVATLRFSLVKRDYSGIDVPYSLESIDVVRFVLKLRPMFNETLGDAVYDEEMTVEVPASMGLCYIQINGYDLPDAGEYFAEILLENDLGEATFSRFVLKVTEI